MIEPGIVDEATRRRLERATFGDFVLLFMSWLPPRCDEELIDTAFARSLNRARRALGMRTYG